MTSPLDGQLDRVRRSLLNTLEALPALPIRFTVRVGDVAFELEWPEGAPPATPGAPAAPDAPVPDAPVIHSPCVGTFYRAAEPGAKPFACVGDLVREGQQVAVVEAMKLMLPVEADRAGRIAAVLPDDGAPVQYGEPLFTLEPLPS